MTSSTALTNEQVDFFWEHGWAVMDDAVTPAQLAALGPNVRFHHSKINSKLPGSNTEVRWHQDFAVTPHTNDCVVTALLMVNEVTV